MRKTARDLFPATLAAAIAMFAASCSANAALVLKPDGSASLSLGLEAPAPVDAKLRQFSTGLSGSAGAPLVAPLFDAVAMASTARAKGMTVAESANPNPRSYWGAFSIGNFGAFAASDPELAKAIRFEKGAGWRSLRARLDRDSAPALASLFPGLDPELLESLQPPALYDNPVTKAEYREMLGGLLGKTAAASLDGLVFSLALSVPGPILEVRGDAKATGSVVTLAMPILDAMTLEKPYELFIKWRE